MLKKIFNLKSSFRSSAVPAGTVNHYWEDGNNVAYRTHEHPVYQEARQNSEGSWDIVQHMKHKILWSTQTLDTHLSLRAAFGRILSREIDNMVDFQGHEGVTDVSLKAHIASRDFPRRHIFSFIKKHPEILQDYLDQVRATRNRRATQSPRSAAA